jgi:hypothetical protein
MTLTPEQIAERNAPAIALLDSWAHASEEEVSEQRETWAALREGLNQSRRQSGERLLFAEDEPEPHGQPVEESL